MSFFKDNPLLMRQPPDQREWTNWGRELSVLIHGGRFAAMADQDATPSVRGGKHFVTANTLATTITAFDDAIEGQEIVVKIGDANTTIDFGGVYWTPDSGDFMRCTFDGTDWLCQITEI